MQSSLSKALPELHPGTNLYILDTYIYIYMSQKYVFFFLSNYKTRIFSASSLSGCCFDRNQNKSQDGIPCQAD